MKHKGKWVASAEYKNGKVLVDTRKAKYVTMGNGNLKPRKG